MARQTFELWEKIFAVKKFDTTQNVLFITPDEIKNITAKEPRLMAKMDNTKDVPPILRKHGYFLLSVGKKGYALVRGDGFHRLEDIKDKVEVFTSRIKFNLLTSGRNTSEMQYLDYCANSGLIEHIVDDGILYSSIRGREGSGSFRFGVNGNHIQVEAAQIEVDLGLEGQNKIVLLEAKSKTPEDFIIRQLFYPYRRFKALVPSKQIVPIFFTYDDESMSYNYWVYRFKDEKDYNSIELVYNKTYKIITLHEIDIDDINPEGSVKYKDLIPQANNLSKVTELIYKVNEGHNDANSIAKYFEFEPRQSSYYREAAEALGFVYGEGSKYKLTETGRHLVSLGTEERNLFFSKVVSNFNLIKEPLDLLKDGGVIKKSDLEKLIIKNSTLTGTTVGRRADSLMSWLKWIGQKTGTFVYEKGELKNVG